MLDNNTWLSNRNTRSILHISKFNCRLDPTRFKDGLRTLMETKASNEQIDRFMKMVQIHDVSEI